MDTYHIASFLDELEKIALAGQVPKVPPPPKTSAPTPAPTAKLAPTPSAKPPNIGTMRTATSVANRGAIQPAGGNLSAQVSQGAKTMIGAQAGAARAARQPTPPRAVTRIPQARGVPLHSKIAPVRSGVSPVRRPYNPMGRNQTAQNVLGRRY